MFSEFHSLFDAFVVSRGIETAVVCVEGTGEGDSVVFFKLVILEG